MTERVLIETAEAAKAAGLRYVSDAKPGIRCKQYGDGFRYIDPKGVEITDEKTLDRIRKLAIPPAYTDVWISPNPDGHLQATGRDARNRKQYRYHANWHALRGENKFERMQACDKHVKVEGASIHFTFTGKSGVKHDISTKDRKLAQIVKRAISPALSCSNTLTKAASGVMSRPTT